MRSAQRNGIIVSDDLNYRPSLWKGVGGPEQAQAVNRKLAPLVDVMIGNEEDSSSALGFDAPGSDFSHLDVAGFRAMIREVVREFPFSLVATTLRTATTATRNDGGAICYCEGAFYESKTRKNVEVYDRVGGGDSFAAGLINGFLAGKSPQSSVECRAAQGALAMTTPGDTSMATLPEVLQAMQGAGARIAR
jgi:2-dehydro-3-deoxygluconokinase